VSYSNLIAVALGIPENRNVGEVTQMAVNAQVREYVPKKIEVKLPEEEKNNNQQPQPEAAAPEDEELIQNLI
jgi:hypothetical protein